MPWLTHWSFLFIFFSPSSCDSCCTITCVPLWFVPKPEVKIKLSKSSEFDLPVQLWAEKLLCQAWLAINHLWPRAKNYDPLKVSCEALSFLPTNCSAALPPQGHLSRLSSPREMRFHFPVQELRFWKVTITHSCPRGALKLCTISSPGIAEICGGLLILQSRWQTRKMTENSNFLFFFFSFPEASLVSYPLDFQEKLKPEPEHSWQISSFIK